MYSVLAAATKFTKIQIQRFVVGRAAGISWMKIKTGEELSIPIKEKKDLGYEHLKELSFKILLSSPDFKAFVSQKKLELGVLEAGVEENSLIEKLNSIILGEQQGWKMVKVIKKDFKGGSMTTHEEYVKIEAYPSVAEQTKATIELHKLTQLDAKTKAKQELDMEKHKSEQGNILSKFSEIQKRVSEADEMSKIVNKTVSLEDYNLDTDGEEKDKEIIISKEDLLGAM